MRKYHSAGGPKEGQREDSVRHASQIGGVTNGWHIRPYAINDTKASHSIDEMRLTRSGILPRLVLVAALALAVWLGLAPVLTAPAALPASAAETEFSAGRAMQHLRQFASEPHPMGSPQHEAAVGYLVDQLSAMGLEPEVQVASATSPSVDYDKGLVPAGRVQNVVARLTGTDSTGSLLLIGNYDSMPTTPGAGDPASSGAVVLETVRALLAGPALRNDVIVAFIDADPNGLIGDEAFVTGHPWGREAALVFAFASGGIRGPVMMDAPTPAATRFFTDVLRVAPHPVAYSPIVSVMQGLGDGGSMLWAARANRTPGLQFMAFNANYAYHSMVNSVDQLDPRILQHHGSYALALTRHFGNRALTGAGAPDGAELVFFNVLPDRVVSYPAAWAGVLAVAVGLLGIGVTAVGLRRRRLTWRGLAAGVLVFPLVVAGVMVVISLAWLAIKTFNPNHRVFLIGVAYNAEVYLVGMAALAVALTTGFYSSIGRWCRDVNLAAGALAWFGVLMGLTGALLPGFSYLFTWPLLAGLMVMGWTFLVPDAAGKPWRRAAALALGSVPVIVLVAPVVQLFFAFFTYVEVFMPAAPLGSAPVLFVVLALGALLPAVQYLGGTRGWLVPGLAALVGTSVIGFGILTSGYDAEHPRPNSIAYVLDADTGEAIWVTTDDQIDGWTRQFLASGAREAGFVAMPNSNPDWVFPAWQAPAPAVQLAAPQLEVLEDGVTGDLRTLRLRVTSARGAPNVYLDVQAPGEITAAILDGKPLDLGSWPAEERDRFRMAYHAVPPEGIEVKLAFPSTGPASIRVEDRSNGLPEIPGMTIEPRPADTMPAPYEMADPTIVSRSFHLPLAEGS